MQSRPPKYQSRHHAQPEKTVFDPLEHDPLEHDPLHLDFPDHDFPDHDFPNHEENSRSRDCARANVLCKTVYLGKTIAM
jgi:hypothetical protein